MKHGVVYQTKVLLPIYNYVTSLPHRVGRVVHRDAPIYSALQVSDKLADVAVYINRLP